MKIMMRTMLRLINRPVSHNGIECFLSHFHVRAAASNGQKFPGCEGRQLCVKDVVLENARTLREQSIPEPKESVELFVAQVLGKSTLHGISPKKQLTCEQVGQIQQMVEMRLKREPVQYILGEWDFCDLVLKVKQPVFIPRPETEELAGFIKTHLQDERSTHCRMLEVGCGSGAITLALLKEFPLLRAVAIDKTTAACELTDVNARRYNLCDRLEILNRDVNDDLNDLGQFDLIVSNPPYISTEDINDLDPQVISFEDRCALDGGTDGLDVVRVILKKSASLMNPLGTVWLEVDTPHPGLIHEMVTQEHPELRYIQTLEDFTSRPRFCVLQSVGKA